MPLFIIIFSLVVAPDPFFIPVFIKEKERKERRKEERKEKINLQTHFLGICVARCRCALWGRMGAIGLMITAAPLSPPYSLGICPWLSIKTC
jgi:hypothetical protein